MALIQSSRALEHVKIKMMKRILLMIIKKCQCNRLKMTSCWLEIQKRKDTGKGSRAEMMEGTLMMKKKMTA